jgi:hypothetical protein
VTGWLLDRPRLAALILAALILLPLAALPRLKLDNSPETYFPVDAPAVQFNRELRRQFPEDQVLVALFSGPALWEAATLQKVAHLGRLLEQLPQVERVLSVVSADHIAPTDDGFSVAPLIDPSAPGRTTAEHWRARALSDRFAPGALVARDGSALAVVVRPRELHDSRQRLELDRLVRQAISASDLTPMLEAIGGPIALDVAQLRSMISDAAVFTPITTAIGLSLLWWMFRRCLVVVLAALTYTAVIGASVAALAVTGRPFTLVDSMLPPLLLALSTAALMHLFSGIAHASQRHATARAWVLDGSAHVARPALFAALTTIAGLLSLAATPVRPIRDFGLAGSVGLALIYLISVWLLPALVLRYDRHPWPVRELGLRRLDGLVRRTTRITLRHPVWVLGGFALVLAAGVPQLANIRVQTDLYKFFPMDHPLTQATRAIERRQSGVTTLELVFDATNPDGLTEPAALAAIAEVQAWLRQQPEVSYTLSLPDIIGEMHWAFGGAGTEQRVLPDRRALIKQYLLIYDGKDLYDLVDRDFRRTRLLMNLSTRGSIEINAFMSRVRQRLDRHPPGGGLAWEVAGYGRLFGDQERLLMRGQIASASAVAAMVFGLLVVLWRSPRAAALCMVPNATPVLLTFVLMGALGIWLDMATALIASVATGIAVDDTIYLYQGYRDRRAAGAGPVFALARTLRRTGPDCLATSAILGTQFLLLGLSAFIPTREFGLLTAFGLIVAVGFDLLMLPALLLVADSPRRRKGTATGPNASATSPP